MKNAVIEAALNMDPRLLNLLVESDTLKGHFFTKVKEYLVFDKVKFQTFVSNKAFLPDSYTAFRNRIGLMDRSGDYLSQSTDVVLAWPYKDCILEGGMTKEEQGHDEVFWNTTLAPDDITRLFEPKVLTGWERWDTDAVATGQAKPVGTISKDDNLLIKGNNLLVLHSLKKQYTSKIKLIYIDPPYNTENDSFRYNDRFNRSSWLTFMRNRLEVSRQLLTQDGLFWISLSDKEAHYCKVLMDEIFGEENFVADIIWNSTKSVTNTALISDAHTHLLLYAKDKHVIKGNRTEFRLEADVSNFKNPDNDPRGKWVADPFQVEGVRKNQLYEIVNPNTGKTYIPNKGCSWKNEKKVFDELLKDNRIVFGKTGDAGPQRKRFWSEACERGRVTTTLWKDLPTTTNGTQHLSKIFGEKVFNNPKPEGLLAKIIQLSTNVGDLVLDYHVGSGTTITTSLKMKRKFIGIEQMDYIKDLTATRIKKVIEGEQGGISKTVSWQGGGSFVYTELADLNSVFFKHIENASDLTTLKSIYGDMKFTGFFRFDLELNDFDTNEFVTLELDEAKQLLMDCLDANQLYVNLGSLGDMDLDISDGDASATRIFYGLEG